MKEGDLISYNRDGLIEMGEIELIHGIYSYVKRIGCRRYWIYKSSLMGLFWQRIR